jgi:type IV pilus assembly protein PilW
MTPGPVLHGPRRHPEGRQPWHRPWPRRLRSGLQQRSQQRGLSLIELMVSLLVGMIIVGAVLAAFVASGTSGRHTQALSQMTEDAAVAQTVLRTHLAMAGYSRPLGVNAQKLFRKAQTEPALFGCEGAFDDLSADIGALGCAPGVDDSDALAIAYEADAANSIVNGTGEPLDCLGNSLQDSKRGVAPDDYHLSYSRFYVDQPEGAPSKGLYCRGPGSDDAQALVDNVERLAITYGVASGVDGTTVARYVTAGELTRSEFEQVISVRVCLVVASTGQVQDRVTPYQGCDPFAEATTPAAGDRRMFRAFTSTVVLHNRLRAAT